METGKGDTKDTMGKGDRMDTRGQVTYNWTGH